MKLHTIKTLLQQAVEKLQAVVEQPHLEAELLLAFVLDKPREYLHAWAEQAVTADNIMQYRHLLARRINQEPLAYLVGSKEFWTLQLQVNSVTLIPRPETELLVETVLERYTQEELSLADLGTGSGAIALAIAKERPTWRVIATDISEEALAIAKTNAKIASLENIEFYVGDWCEALPKEELSVIVSNPPYIATSEWSQYADGLKFEPKLALLAGATGLDAISRIISQAQSHLKLEGLLLIEHGFTQGVAVRQLFTDAAYKNISTLRDLAGLERVTIGQK